MMAPERETLDCHTRAPIPSFLLHSITRILPDVRCRWLCSSTDREYRVLRHLWGEFWNLAGTPTQNGAASGVERPLRVFEASTSARAWPYLGREPQNSVKAQPERAPAPRPHILTGDISRTGQSSVSPEHASRGAVKTAVGHHRAGRPLSASRHAASEAAQPSPEAAAAAMPLGSLLKPYAMDQMQAPAAQAPSPVIDDMGFDPGSMLITLINQISTKLDTDGVFDQPVSEEQAPGYHDFIMRPMCFQRMREKVKHYLPLYMAGLPLPHVTFSIVTIIVSLCKAALPDV